MGIVRKIKRSEERVEDITIQEAFDEYINEKIAKNLSDSSIKNYKKTFKVFMDFYEYGGDAPLNTITQSDMYEWMGTMKLEGLKVTSINSYMTNIKAFLRWAMEEDKGYLKPFKFPKMRGQEEPLKLFSEDDIQILLEKPKNPNDFTENRSWAIVNWVLATGNRAATICEVRISDIDFKTKEITLRHTKNKKAQIIPLSPSLEAVVKKFIKEWRGDAKDGWLFPNIGDEQLTTTALAKSFRKYCTNRGVNQYNIHGLRHNFAKYWVLNNGNIFALQKVLGHSTLEMTRRYVKLFGDDIKTDYEKFSALDTLKRNSKRTQTVRRGV